MTDQLDTPAADTSPLAVALAQLQTDLPVIKKTERADVITQKGSYSFTYADLSSVSEQILPRLGKLGLSFIAKPTFSGDRFVLAYSLLHVSGEREDGEYPLPTGGTPQSLGSAITYGRRYCLCAVTGVSPEGDDDDAAQAEEAARNQGTAKRAPRPRARTAEPAAAADGSQARRKPAARTSAPPLPSEDSGPRPASDEQLTKLATVFTTIGWTDRDDRLRAASTIVGRTLETSRALNIREASELIDTLDRIAEGEDPSADLGELLTTIRARETGATDDPGGDT